MDNMKVRMDSLLVLGLVVIFSMSSSLGLTDPRDVLAIGDLYVNLGLPVLPGWRIGGDPCLESWQGVQCVNSNITAITLSGANLGGQLPETLGNLTSIITIDLSNNFIGGSIPQKLPVTMRQFFLSGNHFTGTIPSSLSNLTLLTDMAINNNLLEGELPDAFQSLTGLINLDLSSNNLSGQLPPSVGNLSSLRTLHVQNNSLSGLLNVLQDLPLTDLNIENNLFSGPIPEKLLTIPNFKKDGNPFNTTIPPSPAPTPLPQAPAGPPVQSADVPSKSSLPEKNAGASKNLTRMASICGAIGGASVVIIVLIVAFICQQRNKLNKEKLLEVKEGKGHESPKKAIKNTNSIIPNPGRKKEVSKDNFKQQKEHVVDIESSGMLTMPPLAEKINAEPNAAPDKIKTKTLQSLDLQSSVAAFSVASLQQYTNSFAEENLIKTDNLCKVFLAELPDGKLLTITKIENVNSIIPADKFLQLILSISELRHPNILELVGYCMEFEQRLLVYKYFSKMTLYDILHYEDDFKKQLSWSVRVDIALSAARVLEYLHEGCRPPVVHRKFDSTKILINQMLAVRVAECGFASALSSSVAQVHALPNYEAPEVSELGSYTDKGDVYSFGVAMLELLTGRKPYDSMRPQEERYLVRWATSQLYDINTLSRIVDPSIDGKVPLKSLSRFADIINNCLRQQPEFRPSMSDVVQDLSRMVRMQE